MISLITVLSDQLREAGPACSPSRRGGSLGERMRLKFVADLFNITNQTRVLRVDQYSELDGGTPNADFLKPDTINFAYPYQVPFHARLAVRFEF